MDVLVVEDDPSVREALEVVLRAEGYAVETARNGVEALEKVKQSRPGIIILDLWMPVMNGWEFLLELRLLPRGETIPVIILTADYRASVRPAGARVFLKKPLDLDILLGAVQDNLDSSLA